MGPDILLMDEPCSALDPISTLKVEETMLELKKKYTIIIVTHNIIFSCLYPWIGKDIFCLIVFDHMSHVEKGCVVTCP